VRYAAGGGGGCERMMVQLVIVDAVVVVLQSVGRRDAADGVRLEVVRHGRGAAAEAERELERVAQDAAEAATERDVDDEVGGRVDDEQQLADGVESQQMLVPVLRREHQTVLKVAFRKRHLHDKQPTV